MVMLNEAKEYLGEPVASYQAAHKRRNEKCSMWRGENPLCMWNYYHIVLYTQADFQKYVIWCFILSNISQNKYSSIYLY